jgi:hypothetical protein
MEINPPPLSTEKNSNDMAVEDSMEQDTERDILVQTIRQWIQNDRDMNLLKQELARRREAQKTITGKLVELMRENEMEEADIMYVQETKKKTISKKGLVPILFRFYKGDTAKAAELTQFIYDNRETVVTEKIKPKPLSKKG